MSHTVGTAASAMTTMWPENLIQNGAPSLMAIWLVRGGRHGEYEQKFIQEDRIYVTWDGLDVNLARLEAREDLVAAMDQPLCDSQA